MPELGIGLGISKGVTPKSKLLLDKYDIDAAFSLRKVRADYNGPCVRVRNNAGNFADIGFLSNGTIDIDALNAHCGANDGTVHTWYNQSTEGGRFNAVQDTAADQPIIYDASAGGYLGYLENTGNMYLRFENQLTGVTDTAIVYEHVTNTDHPFLLGAEDEDVSHGIVVNRNVQGVDGFALQAGSGQTISTHTGDTIGEKFASFIYTGGTDKFISVNGYVAGEGAVTDSIDLDLIFTRDIASGGSEDNNDFVGKIYEVFLSTSDLSGKRIALENSILSANGLTLPEQTLLEKYDGAEGAFSTRCLNREHVGPIVEVRGAQTTAVLEDVYLDSTGVVNKRRITELCTDDENSNALVNGYVKTWYDQSSFGYNVTNTTEAQQPQIHDATNGVVLLNGQPAVKFDGTNDILESSSVSINTEAMICVSSEDADGTGTILRQGTAFIRYKGGNTIEYRNTTELKDNTGNNVPSQSLGEATLTSWYTKGTDFNDTNASWKWYFNGGLLGTKTGNNSSSESSSIKIGAQGFSQELLNGKVCEAIIIDKRDAHYDSADAIHKSINKHYLIYQEATASPSSGFLADYSGAAAAFSVRQLGDANLCMKVRRDGDDAEKNIGFGSDGFVDTTAISDFCGSDDGFVVTWFDQSGNAVDATQGTPADQPKIYDGTDGITKENGYPTINFDGTDDYLEVDGYIVELSQNSASVFVTANGGTPDNNTDYLLSEGDAASPYSSNFIFGGAGTGGSGVVLWVNGTEFGTITNGQHVIGFDYDGTNFQAHLDGSTSGSSGTATVNTETDGGGTYIGTRADGTTSFYDGNIQEIITYKSDKSSDRSDIEENINDGFNIYPDADTTPESGFLKEFSGAAAAYSVRKLGDSPVAMRVRKTVSSVHHYQVIGFDSNGDLDTAAISEFGGSNDVHVHTWYDQSGNGRHQVQDTNAEQPKIYDGTDGITYENDKPAVEFSGGFMSDSSANKIDILGHSSHSVFNRGATSDREVLYGADIDTQPFNTFAAVLWNTSAADIVLFTNQAQGSANTNLAEEIVGQRTLSTLMPDTDSGTPTVQLDNQSVVYSEDNIQILNDSDFTLRLGSQGYNEFSGRIQEFVIYEDGKSGTDRTNIQKNQNEYFLVHQAASTSPSTGLLSEAPGAKVAFSTRQLGDALLCMKVVSDATGNPTKNIGFKNGELDIAAIEEFCGTNIGRVETWYDQSGNGNDLTPIENDRAYVDTSGTAQTFGDSVGNGPKPIVFMPDGTASAATYRFSQGFVRIGGKPAVKFRNRLMATESLGDQMVSAFSVLKHSGSNSQFVYYLNPYAYLAVAGSPSAPYHEGYEVQQNKGRIAGNGSPIIEETPSSSTFFGVTNDSTVINGKDVILSHKANEPTNASTSDFMVMGGRFVSSNAVNASQPVVAEFIGYTDSVDFDETRAIVETNMNSRHKIFKKFSSGLLDQYPGAAGAYSLRRLSSTYTGPLIRVVNTEDGTPEYDIYPNGEGDLEINQIYASVGGRATNVDSSVSVVKWYDQSGNGNHVVAPPQLNNAPQIKATTQLVTRDGLRPALEFDSSSYLSSEVITNTGKATAYVVANADDTAANKAIFFVPEVFAFLTSTEVLQLFSGITSEAPSGDTTTIETNDTLAKNLIFFGNDGSTTFGGVNGQAFVTEANVSNSASGYDKIKIGANASNTINFDGKIQEAVYYNSDQRSIRAGIEKNVNEYYEVFDEPLLDVVPDAAAAYSLRKLRSDYTGPAINVYNGTDYKDIYFKANGSLDTGAISRFCGSNDGTVAIWYDQSGESNHAEQTTATDRPKIYDGTNGLVTENGKPAVEFSEGDYYSTSSAYDTGTSNTHFYVAQSTGLDQRVIDTRGTGALGTVVGWQHKFSNATDVSLVDDGTTGFLLQNIIRSGQVLVSSELSQSGLFEYSNGVLAASDTSATIGSYDSNNPLYIGANVNGADTQLFVGKLQEIVLYNTDQSSNRQVIEANINHHYSIY